MDFNINATGLVIYFALIILVPIILLIISWRLYKKTPGTFKSRAWLIVFVITLVAILLGLAKVILGRN